MDFLNFSIPFGKCKASLKQSTKNFRFQYFFSRYTLKETCLSNSVEQLFPWIQTPFKYLKLHDFKKWHTKANYMVLKNSESVYI